LISPSLADRSLGGTNKEFIGLAKSKFLDLIKSFDVNKEKILFMKQCTGT